ncbi:MAG: xanthine dehydrogenase family protein [Kiritimatiellae bacterium]|nr:xanthine dehydrogenase family protein [Kiritimatiellia bacterium]
MTDDREQAKNSIGTAVFRLDAADKVRGRAQYVDDLEVPGAWYGFVVRSPVSHGRLRRLTLDPAFDWSRVVVVTPEDIPGPNVCVMHDRSMPVLAEDEILYLGEPLAVIAAPTDALAREAGAHVHAEIEERPAVLTLEERVREFREGRLVTGVEDSAPSGVGGFAGGTPASPDVLCSQSILKGDVERGFAEADRILENEYTAGYQEQLYIEPQGLVAIPEPDGSVFIQGSMQCPYYIVEEIHEALGLPPGKVRVKQAVVGGAFGGKEEFPSMLAAYCALPALKCGRPVKIVYDRNQDILFTTKRHPVWARYRTGVKNDGTITAIRVDYILNGGAYLTLSDVVMYRGILHAAMGYRCEHVFVNGLAVRTHVFPSGAFRGFGAPQGIWGLESHIDEIAAALGMAPHEFRLKNCLRLGDTTPTAQTLRDSVGSPAVLEQALAHSRFAEKLARCSHGKAGEKKWYGIGLAFFAHGSGFTGDGEARIQGVSALDLDLVEGRPMLLVRVSSTEMGQGAHTVLAQIAADGLSVGLDHVRCPLPDTALVPNSGPTVASRTTMVVGHSVYCAAQKMKRALEEHASERMGPGVVLANGIFRSPGGKSRPFAEMAARFLEEKGQLRTDFQFVLPPDLKWDQKTFRGDSYPAYAWGCNVAEVEVDPLTLEVRLKRVTACFDIGRVINLLLAKGQVEGGLVQAFGYALMEKMGVRDGRFDADRMQTYVVPTTLDIPEFDITFVEYPYDFAAPGAKGVGEMPMDGLAPAVANAVFQATGIRMRDLPITPEKLLAGLPTKHTKHAK